MIEHQFLHKEFFFPNWEIETLVLGTFNPNGGEATDYFYGRLQNNFWRTIEKLCKIDQKSLQGNFVLKLELMKFYKFGCIDIIKGVTAKTDAIKTKIFGKGYSDSVLFTQKHCELIYQFDEIKEFILDKNIKTVINSWGKRNSPKYFENAICDLRDFCQNNKVKFIEECPSPSGRFRSEKHIEALLVFYKEHLIK